MRVLSRWKTQLLFYLAVLGPGFITANVDNDAGGIYTYSVAGAQFGYSLLWTMLPMALTLAFAQEISARMGVVTGKGLSELIREEYGIRITFFLMVALILCNFGNVVAEFAGVASSLGLFGISKYVSVPLAAVLVWSIVVYGNYHSIEKIFLFASFLYIAYILTGFMAGPRWQEVFTHAVTPPDPAQFKDPAYLYLAVGIIGATIAPWQQFYLQSSIVDKGVTPPGLKLSRLDAIVGSVFSVVIAGFIVVACAATLFVSGSTQISNAADAAHALRPLAGQYASMLFAIGLFNASLFAASILPLSTAYTVCEALGFETGLDKKFRDAKIFYWMYTLLVGVGAAVVLVPDFPFVAISVLSQVVNGFLLPVVLVFMLMLVNKTELLGRHTNPRWFNIFAWGMTALISLLTLVTLWNMSQT